MIADVIDEVKKDIDEINTSVVNNTGKPRGYYPIAYTEYNTRGDYTTTMINAFFVTEMLGQMIDSRVSISDIWVNEWKLNGNHSKGLFALSDPKQANYTARPSYTPYYYFDKYYGDQMIKATVGGDQDIKVFASTFNTGEVGLVIMNYSNKEKNIDFAFSPNTNFETIYWDVVHSDNANIGNTKFYVNGKTSTTQGGGPTPLTSVPANTADYSQDKVLSVPKLSITYITFAKATMPDMVINFEQTDVSCFGDCDGSIRITSVENSIEPVTYKWNTGDTGKTIENICANSYSLSITDNTGRKISKNFIVTQPEDIIFTVSQTGNITDTSSGFIHITIDQDDNYSYFWSGPGDFISYNKDIDNLSEAGCYNLTVQNTITGCSKDTTVCIDDLTGTIEYDYDNIYFYPNPAQHTVSIHSIEPVQEVLILDMRGRILLKKSYIDNQNNLKVSIDLTSVDNGIYLLKINKSVFKLVVLH